MKKWSLFITCCWLTTALFAGNGADISPTLSISNNGEINGIVYDQITGETLPGATIRITSGATQINTVTDTDGYYSLKPIAAGTYDLEFRFLGKQTILKKGVVVGIDQIVQLDIHMNDDTNTIGIFVVSEYTIPLIEPGKPISVTITGDQIQKLPTRNVNDFISSANGIYQSDTGDGFNVRGARTGSTVFIVDGVKQASVTGIPASAIGQMQVITGGIPARYGDATGGVIVIETKNGLQ